MPFDDRTTNLDLNGPDIEIKTQAYGHEEGSTTETTTVNPFGADAGRTGGVIEITGIGTASWPTGFSTYVSNTGTIGYHRSASKLIDQIIHLTDIFGRM